MKKNNFVFMNLLKFAAPAAIILSAAAFVAGYTLPALGVLAGAAVSLANFYFLEKIIRSPDIAPFKMIAKTAAAVAVLFGCVCFFGAPGVFAGIFLSGAGLKSFKVFEKKRGQVLKCQ